MKQRIFIAIHYLELGGAEISLIGLLHALDYSKYDVDLFVYSHRGEFMKYIPPQVNLLPQIGAYSYLESPIKEALKAGYIRLAFRRVLAKIRYSRQKKELSNLDDYSSYHITAESVMPALPSLEKFGEYDLAISYLMPHNYVLKKVKAKKRACWIHTDYVKVWIDVASELSIWNGYDHIVSISEDVTESFVKTFPSLSNKIVLMPNILPRSFVESRANEEAEAAKAAEQMPKFDGVINILSIGRFCYQKNYDNIPDICRQVLEKGYKVCWYIIGFGSDEQLIRDKIKESGVENNVIILGKKSNPYPYIKRCDVYLQPSRYEGNSVTVREAQMLGRPVIVTAYPTASSQVEDGIDGIIVPLDNKGCAEGIAGALEKREKLSAIESALKQKDFGNASSIEVFNRLFE